MLSSISTALVDGAPDAILITSGSGSWLDANPAALTLLGYSRAALRRLSIADIDATKAVWTGCAQAHALLEGEWHGDVAVCTSDGRMVPVAAHAIMIQDADGPLVAWFLRDITAHTEVGQGLRDALEVAERGYLARGIFIDLMSHELRTPLQAVLGYAEFLLREPAGSLSSEQREDISYIRRAGERMISLVDQALELSRMNAGGIILASEPVDLAEVIETVRQDVAPQAAAKALDVEIALPLSLPAVLGDAERVRQILLNLVGNAVKFTAHGRVCISASEVSGGVEIEVSDSGKGIAADQLPHIFEAFHQVPDGPTQGRTGSGLGLAIAAHLTDQMAGSLDVSSVPNIGTTFRLVLPCVSARLVV